MDLIVRWCCAHNFPFKIIDKVIYWQTNCATAEYNATTDHTTWHEKDYFFTV